jgi:hypothetical protein
MGAVRLCPDMPAWTGKMYWGKGVTVYGRDRSGEPKQGFGSHQLALAHIGSHQLGYPFPLSQSGLGEGSSLQFGPLRLYCSTDGKGTGKSP